MAIDGSIDRPDPRGDKPWHIPLSAQFVDFCRSAFGMVLGLAAILLPAMVWSDMEALYAEFGAPVVLVMFAPLAILVRTYGRTDEDD
jgi:hypothetical protein